MCIRDRYYAMLPTAHETQRLENRPCSPARYVASDAEADGFDGNCNIFSFGCSQGDNTPLPDDGDLCGDRQGFNREQGLEITVRHLVHTSSASKILSDLLLSSMVVKEGAESGRVHGWCS